MSKGAVREGCHSPLWDNSIGCVGLSLLNMCLGLLQVPHRLLIAQEQVQYALHRSYKSPVVMKTVVHLLCTRKGYSGHRIRC